MDENMNKAQKKGIMLNKWQALGFVLLVIVITCGISFAGLRGTNSKTVYTTLLTELAKNCRESAEKLPDFEEKAGKLTMDTYSKTEYDFGDSSLSLENDTVESAEKYEVTFKGKMYFISTDTFKALFDDEKDEVFVRKVENGKEVGDVIHSTSYEATSQLYNYISSISSLNSSGGVESQRNGLETYAILFETVTKYLDDSYFIDSVNNGINEYTISMNSEQMCEFSINVFRDLMNNKRFTEMNDLDSYDEEDINDAIDDIKEFFDEMKDLKFTFSLYAKGNIDKLVGMKITINGTIEDEPLEFLMDINSTGTKPINDTEDLKGKIVYKYDDTDFLGDISITPKEVKLVLDINYKEQRYSYLDAQFKTTENKSKIELLIKTDDNKRIDESSNVVSDLSITSNGESHKLLIRIKGNDGKSFVKSNRVSVLAKIDDEEEKEVISLYSDDDKSLDATSKMVLELNVEEQKVKVILEAKDKKQIIESSEIVLSASDGKDNIELFSIKAEDSKAILKSTDLLIKMSEEIGSGSMELRITTKDKKEFAKTSNLEINYKSNPKYGSPIEMKMIIKGDKEFNNAKKLEFDISGKSDEQEFKAKGKVETLDNKALREATLFKGNFELIKDEDNYVIVSFDSNKGLDAKVGSKTSSYYYKSESKGTMKLEFLKDVNFDKLMDTKNAKEETSEKEAVYIINPDYVDYYSKWLEEYDWDSYDYDDYDYDYDYDYDDFDYDYDYLSE